MGEQNYCGAGIVGAKLVWEQGLPAMNTARSLWNRGACIASKLYSHRVARQALLPHSGRLHQRFALSRLGADDPPPLVVGRAPLTDVFHMSETAEADLLFVKPAHAGTWRRHRRADIAVERFGRPRRAVLAHAVKGPRTPFPPWPDSTRR